MSKQIASMCRRLAGCSKYDNVSVILFPGPSEPTECGRGPYHTTPSGKTIVRYPSAYRWPTWYHASTRRVEVGADWISSAIS